MHAIPPTLQLRETSDGHALTLMLGGAWTVGAQLPALEPLTARLGRAPALHTLSFDCQALADWDSILLAFLLKTLTLCEGHGIEADRSGLPNGVQGMLNLARAVPERQDTQRPAAEPGALAALGRRVQNNLADAAQFTDFIGEAALAAGRALRGKSRFRGSDLLELLMDCGPKAVPIVSLISFLVGMILAFVGAVQLKMFGAQIFIADLVGLGMAREMGAMMTAIIMAGRTGAAYAAQLGSMQANDEIDALQTSGFPPMEFLVLPRLTALTLALPLLCLYSDCLGILGGALVSSALFDVSYAEYLNQIQNRLVIGDFMTGISKSAVFGLLVALAGCLRGLQCGRNSTEVGLATTSAVVTGIVLIVVADAVMTLVITTLKLG